MKNKIYYLSTVSNPGLFLGLLQRKTCFGYYFLIPKDYCINSPCYYNTIKFKTLQSSISYFSSLSSLNDFINPYPDDKIDIKFNNWLNA